MGEFAPRHPPEDGAERNFEPAGGGYSPLGGETLTSTLCSRRMMNAQTRRLMKAALLRVSLLFVVFLLLNALVYSTWFRHAEALETPVLLLQLPAVFIVTAGNLSKARLPFWCFCLLSLLSALLYGLVLVPLVREAIRRLGTKGMRAQQDGGRISSGGAPSAPPNESSP